jgi:hypothetical protein
MNAVSKCKVSNFLEFFFEKWNNLLITRENRKMRIFQSVKNQRVANFMINEIYFVAENIRKKNRKRVQKGLKR